jgi:hypothetical protein
MSCDHRGGHSCGSQSFRAGTGIRVAAVDENGPSDSLAQVQAINNDRCSDHLVASKDAGDGAALFRGNEREIEQARFLDAAMDTGCLEALWRGDPAPWRCGWFPFGHNRERDVPLNQSGLGIGSGSCQACLLRESQHEVHGLNRLACGTFHKIIQSSHSNDRF